VQAAAAVLILAFLLSVAPLGAATVEIGGKEIQYRAQPGTITLNNEDGRARGSIFYTAYQRTDLKPKKRNNRPVAFLFNGGPGSSSAWLHLGAFGPKRLVLGAAGLTRPQPPFRTTANRHSLLDVADLVFIDPIGTGFSRAVNVITARSFYGFRDDVRSVAEFIKLYLDQEGRGASPCFLIGESYGAMRACGLAPELEEKHGIVVNGLVLVSGPVVMGKRSTPDLALPTAAATAHYHGLLEPELQALDREELLGRVGRFVKDSYRPALENKEIDADARAAVAAQVRAYTGLSRLRGLKFSLREARVNAIRKLDVESVGIYDVRVTSERLGMRFRITGDPALMVIRQPMDAVISDYLKGELGYQTEHDYRLMIRIPLWSHSGSQASKTLTRALQTNRGLPVFVASGYYDMVTPMAVVRSAVEDATMTPEQRQNFRFENYEGGHMMYTNLPTLKKLSRDLRAFIRQSAKRKRGPALIPTSSRGGGEISL
jgi:carboxypeptidase C (cathepsin A)